MTDRKDQDETDRAEKPPMTERGAAREHAGSKPRLTDEQARAELLRRQREREGRR
jgi:hypothetical protein